MYLELATKALEAPTARAAQGDAAGFDPHTTHHDGGTDGDGDEYASYIRSLSPESLLSSAEKYTDQALTAGSRLPMARLVKGRALALRGQHKVSNVASARPQREFPITRPDAKFQTNTPRSSERFRFDSSARRSESARAAGCLRRAASMKLSTPRHEHSKPVLHFQPLQELDPESRLEILNVWHD